MLTITISVSGQKIEFKKYQIKSGIAQYVHEGNVTGTETVWFDDWGEREFRVTETETKMLGMRQKTNSCQLTIGLDNYQWDPVTKKGTHVKNTLMEEVMKDPNFDQEEFARELMKSTGFRKTGEATIDGRNCDVWEGMNSKVWVWKNNGLAVRSEMHLIVNVTIKLTEFESNPKISSEKFQVPVDVKFTEEKMPTMEELQQQMDQIEENREGNEETGDTVQPAPSLKNILKQFKKR